MANSFAPKGSSIPLRPKADPAASIPGPAGPKLPEPKPVRKQYSIYVSTDMMERVKRVAQQRKVTIGAVVEACISIALDQLEE